MEGVRSLLFLPLSCQFYKLQKYVSVSTLCLVEPLSHRPSARLDRQVNSTACRAI